MKRYYKSSLLLFLGIFLTSTLFGQINQQLDQQTADYYEAEYIDDPYIEIPYFLRAKTPAYQFKTTEITTVQVNVDSFGNNLVGDAANEPSIAIDPTDPTRMAIGWRQFETIQSNFRQAGLSISYNGGANWLPMEPLESDLFRSDPVLETDSDGRFYYNSLASDYACSVFKSDDLQDWSDKIDAKGGDKQWMVIDKTNQSSNGQIYAFWKEAFTVCSGNFARSIDDGESFEDCSFIQGNPTRGTLAIGPDGELYACGGIGNTFRVLKSSTAKDPNSAVSWEVNNTVNLKGSQALYAGPNPAGMLGQVWVATDHSDLPSRGNVYLLSAVTRNDNNDPADIMFSRSIDGGNTWSEAIKINDDNSTTNWQWFGSLSVAPNGRIDATWLDTRDDAGTFLSSLYYSYSFDGGLTWSENEKLSESFDPHLGWPNQQKIGDYFHMISFDEGAHLAWAATFNGEEDIYYSFIPAPEPPVSVTYVQEQKSEALSIKAFPNPVIDYTDVYFYTDENTTITIEVLDVMGRTLETLTNDYFLKGNHNLSWRPDQNVRQNPGIYILRIQGDNGYFKTSKVVVL